MFTLQIQFHAKMSTCSSGVWWTLFFITWGNPRCVFMIMVNSMVGCCSMVCGMKVYICAVCKKRLILDKPWLVFFCWATGQILCCQELHENHPASVGRLLNCYLLQTLCAITVESMNFRYICVALRTAIIFVWPFNQISHGKAREFHVTDLYFCDMMNESICCLFWWSLL